MGVFLVAGDLADILLKIGTTITAVFVWFSTALTSMESVIATSVLLQILLGLSAVGLVMALVKKVISVIKGFGRAK